MQVAYVLREGIALAGILTNLVFNFAGDISFEDFHELLFQLKNILNVDNLKSLISVLLNSKEGIRVEAYTLKKTSKVRRKGTYMLLWFTRHMCISCLYVLHYLCLMLSYILTYLRHSYFHLLGLGFLGYDCLLNPF